MNKLPQQLHLVLPQRQRPSAWVLLLGIGLFLGGGACQKTKPTTAATPPIAAPRATYFTCPMHPQVQQSRPGSCPICHMDLVPAHRNTTTSKTASAPADEPATPDLQLTPQQMELGNIQVQTVGTALTPNTSPASAVVTGTVVADASRTASISSRVAGRVEQLFVRQTGQVLQRGQPLFALYSDELQTLQREYVLALAQADKSGPPYGQFAEATAQKLRLLGLSAGQVQALARTGRVQSLVTYYSPQTGTVQTLNVVQGQYVVEGSPLLTLSDLSQVWVEAQLYPAEASRLPLGTPATVQVPGQTAVRGKVVFLSPELSGNSQVVLARIAVPNPGGQLRPGAQANVLISKLATAPAASISLLPPAAIIHDGAASYVWQQTGERQFRRVPVQTGPGMATLVPVLRGLLPGSRVVVAGAYLLESEFTLRQGAANDHMSGMAM